MSPTPNPPNPADKDENNVVNNDLNEPHIIEEQPEEGVEDGYNGNYYQILMQGRSVSNTNEGQNDDTEESSDDEDDDEENELDPDLDFEQLAATRAFIQSTASNNPTPANQVIETNHNLFEMDYFERKVKLECEEIDIDDNKSKKITDIMSNFK